MTPKPSCEDCTAHEDISSKVYGMWESRWLIITIFIATYSIFYLVMDNAFTRIQKNSDEIRDTKQLIIETNMNLRNLCESVGLKYQSISGT